MLINGQNLLQEELQLLHHLGKIDPLQQCGTHGNSLALAKWHLLKFLSDYLITKASEGEFYRSSEKNFYFRCFFP